ncbi:energy transducer TonB [Tenacibaculum pacificus]|uniref:energy transducer TonB n=1 Tax=Tenacibaculum pacificus TaxID=3018314 RepID=UPI0022F3AD4A|nr:energy transducer TonB [Tenacibaculum pacificus]WBX73724.1 energy transducer TonB [Tenacibaculum pacificus]
MMLHIQKHFRYPNDAVISKTQGEVWIRFIIDENGTVTNIKTLGPENGEVLIDEAIRVVSNLPKFTPAMKKGKKVHSKFGFPINFSLEE